MAIFVSTLNGFRGLGSTDQEHTDLVAEFLGAAESALEVHAGLSAASCRQKFESIRQIHALMVMAETHTTAGRAYAMYQKRLKAAQGKQQQYVDAFKNGCLSGVSGLGILRNGTGSAARSHRILNAGQAFVVEVTYADGSRSNHQFDRDERRDMDDFIRDLYE